MDDENLVDLDDENLVDLIYENLVDLDDENLVDLDDENLVDLDDENLVDLDDENLVDFLRYTHGSRFKNSLAKFILSNKDFDCFIFSSIKCLLLWCLERMRNLLSSVRSIYPHFNVYLYH